MANFNTDPSEIELINENTLKITWKDKHQSVFDSFKLRITCPCAHCRGGHGGKIGDNTKHIHPPIFIREFARVGRYALSFDFNDLHRGGIYSYDYLRNICPCEQCKGDAKTNFNSGE